MKTIEGLIKNVDNLVEKAVETMSPAEVDQALAVTLMSIISGLSAPQLEELSKIATERATDLRSKEPSYRLALSAGIKDRSYQTVRYGRVESYSGEAFIVLEDGSRWIAIGHGPTGGPDYVSKEGYIEFVPVEH